MATPSPLVVAVADPSAAAWWSAARMPRSIADTSYGLDAFEESP
jgi:hypothetical protein